MYRAFYEGMTLTHLPLFTLLLFIVFFIGVLVRVLRNRDDHQALSAMPLADDERTSQSKEARR